MGWAGMADRWTVSGYGCVVIVQAVLYSVDIPIEMNIVLAFKYGNVEVRHVRGAST